MKILTTLFDATITVVTTLAALALLLMVAHISVDVVLRYAFGSGFPGTLSTVSNFYMAFVVFIPLAFTERRNGHISVEVLVEHFPIRVRRALNIFAMVLGVGIFAALAYRGWFEAERARATGVFAIEQNVRIWTWPARYFVPLGCALIALTLSLKIALAFQQEGRDHTKELFRF